MDYIRKHADGESPFLLYFAHSMPHVPLSVSDKFRGKSQQGMYGDVIMEIDWSIGEVYKALEEAGIADNTLVIYTSDNGPWLQMGNHGGCADPLRLGKGNVFDGGHKVFCLMTWPKRIAPGSVCTEPISSTDLFPTFAHISGGVLPDGAVDGEDIYDLLLGIQSASYRHGPIYFYAGARLCAVRDGDWKYHTDHAYHQTIIPGRDGFRGAGQRFYTQPVLYNLREDVGENRDVLSEHPEIGARLNAMMEALDKALKASKRRSYTY